MSSSGYYHCSIDSVSRASGRSAVAAAAYRAGEKLTDERTGIVHDFRRRKGVVDSFIVFPAGAPAWAVDRERLWNEAEAAEPRVNGRIATELELALPHELNAAQRRALAESFARMLVDTYGVAVDVALHLPGEGRDHRNHHAHMVVTQRVLGATGFGEVAHKHSVRKKIKGKYRQVEVSGIAALTTDVMQLRVQWAGAVNAAYREAGLDIRVDHRSHVDRGLEDEPTQHMGPAAAGMERRGESSERGEVNRDIQARNADRDRLNREAGSITAEIIDLASERAKRAGSRADDEDPRARSGQGRPVRPAGADMREHRKVVDHALSAVTERLAAFTWRDLNRQLTKALDDELLCARLTDDILADPALIGLRERSDGPVSHYTTLAALEAERGVLVDAASLAQARRHAANRRAVDRTSAAHTLNAEQAQALRFATGPEGLAIIAGEAGTGKTRTLGAIRDAYQASGHRVIGLAWTNSVVQDLRQDGFEANTIAAELKHLNAGTQGWGSKDVLIVDEAAMLATKHLASVLDRARQAGAKVILAGDERQLASIERGGMFEPLRTMHGAAELHVVQRVKDPDQQRAFNLMHEGRFREALGIFDAKGAVHWSKTEDSAMEALKTRYAADVGKDPDKTRFIFAYTNDQVDRLNLFAREVFREGGALGRDKELVTTRGAALFAVGDRVQFIENGWTRKEKQAGLVNGVVGTVLEIETGWGKPRMSVDLDVAKGDAPRQVSFVVGPDRKEGEFDAVRHGYAGTIYKGQGRTLDQPYLFHSHHWREASSYVALTRHREEVNIFVARETAPDLDRLARQMGRDETKRAAISFWQDGKDADEPFVEPMKKAANDRTNDFAPEPAPDYRAMAREALSEQIREQERARSRDEKDLGR